MQILTKDGSIGSGRLFPPGGNEYYDVLVSPLLEPIDTDPESLA